MAHDLYSTEKLKIEKEIIKLQKKVQALHAKRRIPVIASIIRSMREYDIAPEEIIAAYDNKSAHTSTQAGPYGRSKRIVPVKYRHPDTGDAWTGRGKAPGWITSAEAQGTDRNHFLVTQAANAKSD